MNRHQKTKQNLRRHDRNWKSDKFPAEYGSKYQIHHDWENGATVYFLTPQEHEVLTRAGR